MNKIIFESNQGCTNQEIEIDEFDKLFVIRDGQMYQIRFDCFDALGVSTNAKTYLAKVTGDDNLSLICNYPISACPNCGDNRLGKGSLVQHDKSFCNEECYEEWRVALMEKGMVKSTVMQTSSPN